MFCLTKICVHCIFALYSHGRQHSTSTIWRTKESKILSDSSFFHRDSPTRVYVKFFFFERHRPQTGTDRRRPQVVATSEHGVEVSPRLQAASLQRCTPVVASPQILAHHDPEPVSPRARPTLSAPLLQSPRHRRHRGRRSAHRRLRRAGRRAARLLSRRGEPAGFSTAGSLHSIL